MQVSAIKARDINAIDSAARVVSPYHLAFLRFPAMLLLLDP